jgi:hypothetical protein
MTGMRQREQEDEEAPSDGAEQVPGDSPYLSLLACTASADEVILRKPRRTGSLLTASRLLSYDLTTLAF